MLTQSQDIFPDSRHSILAHRIVAQVYQDEEDLENAMRAAENGLELVIREEQNRAIELPRCVTNTCCRCS
jgi:superkiller protein 3